LSRDREHLQSQITRLLAWERRKRRENVLVAALFYGLVAALCVPLVGGVTPIWAGVVPTLVLLGVLPYLLLIHRWRPQDTARTLVALDKSLRLDERATTAWELLQLHVDKGAALLVLRQTAEKLKDFDPRALFPRHWNWHGYFIVPMLALWLAMFWYGAGFQTTGGDPSQPPTLAQKVREFAQRLQEKGQTESLPQTLKTGRELEKKAQRGIETGMADEQFKRELADMAEKMADARKATGQSHFEAGAGRQQLEDLRAELEAARDLFDAPDGAGRSWQDRLAGLPQLKNQMEKHNLQDLNQGQMRSFLDKLDQQLAGELDRRTLVDAEQFLQQLAQRGPGQTGDGQARSGGNEGQETVADADRERKAGSAPGKEPGKNIDKPASLPEYQGGARAEVKGKIGDGERSGLFFKAKPAPGASKLSQEEVIASYRRQAEAELNTERIPEELKDTIRNYFLSLEKTP
jgi:hypothetical protein